MDDLILLVLVRLVPILLAVVVTFGTVIGVNAIDNVSEMQDAKMTRFCKSVPVGASYDEMCKEFR